ncbi:hypothetical protein IHE55_04770 [Streptomyces pactum]|uniref:Transferase n=1 Tax=Streptomyces pactum TaxID=68249 RepID=A0ABS0NG45_9ACTN|nr:hypothetical protein [Streptomyces pactum]MBH5334151.1 hypothetical protein [Streptomyces pactum]
MSVPPRADCTADASGGLVFHVSGGPAARTGERAELVLLRRGADPADRGVRLPLHPAADGRLNAELTLGTELPEGRWDVHVALARDGAAESGQAGPVRLLPGVNDLRALVDRVPEPGGGPVAVRVPYPTKHGNLSLRSWLRAAHAEAGDLGIDATAVTVHGELYGVADPAAALAGAVAEARLRDRAEVVTVPVTADGARFTFTLDHQRLADGWRGGTEVWDLWLCPASGEPARVARLLDDVADRKPVFVYPARRVTAPHGPAQAGPYYTADNDLSVRVEPAG